MLKRFNLMNKVRIVPLSREGRILQINETTVGFQYQVRYFDHAEPLTAWFYDEELQLIVEQPKTKPGTLVPLYRGEKKNEITTH